MDAFQLVAALITVAAIAGFFNEAYLKLPSAIGIMIVSLILSVVLFVLHILHVPYLATIAMDAKRIDFQSLVLHGLLAILLFAGGLEIDFNALKRYGWAVGILATVGTVIAAFSIAGLLWLIGPLLGFSIPFIYALLFGSLIAPTDPIAVLGILKKAGVPIKLEIIVVGESLFNDGIGIVLFLTVLGIIMHPRSIPSPWGIAEGLVVEIIGGILWGLLVGWLGSTMLAQVRHYPSETLLTIAMALGGYVLGEVIGVSAPIAAVTSGVFVSVVRCRGMSIKSVTYLDVFWELMDEIFNALFFFLMGVEVLVLKITSADMALSAVVIVITLLARYISVWIPLFPLRRPYDLPKNTVRLLTWGGLHGGLSLAMALSLPNSPYRPIFLALTYNVVVFSVVVQGLTIGPLMRRIAGSSTEEPARDAL